MTIYIKKIEDEKVDKKYGSYSTQSKYNIIEIDDFLPKQYADQIEGVFKGSDFPWHYGPVTADMEIPKHKTFEKVKDSFQFTHPSFQKNMHKEDAQPAVAPDFEMLRGVMLLAQQKVGFELMDTYRVKSNFLTQQIDFTKDNFNAPHIDYYDSNADENYTILYYVNDSDGDTRWFDKEYNIIKQISPKKGKAVLFHSNILHAGSNPINYKDRLCINFILRMKNVPNSTN